MKILIVNKYFYLKGGSEQSMFKIASLFESKGHDIAYFCMADPKNIKSPFNEYFASNINYNDNDKLSNKIKLAIKIIYNKEVRNKFERIINDFKPDIVQAHNIYHHLSVSILEIAKKHDIPVFKFLHDYKVACPVYTLISNGQICNDKCRNRKYFWAALKRCNEKSLLKSLVNAAEMYANNLYPNYYGMVDLFISPSAFLSQKVLSMGFKPKRIITLHHFADTAGIDPAYSWKRKEILYFGRISKEKGIRTLIDAVRNVDIQLKIIGSGPLYGELKGYIQNHKISNVLFIPHLEHKEILKRLAECMFTVTPSECYENCPNTVIESFTCGKPVIGANIGGIPELVIDNKTGLTFTPGNADELREKIRLLISNPDMIVSFGKNARVFVENELNPEKYYSIFMENIRQILKSKDTKMS